MFIDELFNTFFTEGIEVGGHTFVYALLAIPIMLGLPYVFEHLDIWKEDEY